MSVKHRFLGSIPRAHDSVHLGWGTSNKLPGDADAASLDPMQVVSGDQRKQGACSLQWIEGFKEGMAVNVLVFNLQNENYPGQNRKKVQCL